MTESPDVDIVLVGPAHPYRGGVAHFNESLHAGFVRRGYSVETVTFTRQYPSLLFPGKTQEMSSSAMTVAVPSRKIDSVNPATWFMTAQHIRSRNPELVVFHHWMPFFAPAFGTIARRLRNRGARILVVVHNAIPHERRPGDALLTKFFFSAADGFVALSRQVEDDLETLGQRQPVRQVHHPTYDRFGTAEDRSQARRKLDLPADAPILLFFGFIREYKGLQTLLSAMPAIIESDPTTFLVVAGEFYDDESEYLSQIQQLDLSDHVRMVSDYIPDDDVSTFFSAADVVVQPYRTATQSGVAQIAFHFDRPVITTRVGGLPETVNHGLTGLIVDPEDPAALAAAVTTFFREEMRDTMSSAVAREKLRFGWPPLLDALCDLSNLSPRTPRVS